MPDEAATPGDIEAQVRSDIAALVTAHPMGESLAEMAYKLAQTLDRGFVKDLAVAGINKELRETLCELARLAEGDDDDLADALSVPTSAHNRTRLQRGPASAMSCVDCGQRADDWSLKHDSEQRVVHPSGAHAGLAFSPNPDDYAPRCKPCHGAYDREARRGRPRNHGTEVPAPIRDGS